jgi:hypothetical protein
MKYALLPPRPEFRAGLSCLVVLGVCLLSALPCAARPKTDVIAMVNGDRLSVEIKELQRGKLTCKTNSMGTASIEWEDVVFLESQYYFRVATSEGRLLFGSIAVEMDVALQDSLAVGGVAPKLEYTPFRERTLDVLVGALVVEVPMSEVVEITALERSFWSRIDGSLSLGGSFTKVSGVAEFYFDWRNVYRAERNRIELDAITNITRQSGDETPKRRIDYSAGYTRRLKHSWSGVSQFAFQRNDELGLRRRYIASLGAGFNPIWKNWTTLNGFLGVAMNAEEGEDSNQLVGKWEAQLGGSYAIFKYNSPKTDLSLGADGFAGLTESGRYRADVNAKLRQELWEDLFFEITYYLSWDNRNPTTGTQSTDYGLASGLSWTY